MINKLIIDTLRPLKIPVSFQRYSGKAKEYITFHEYSANGEAYEDDVEAMIGHYIQVDIWSKQDYTPLVSRVKDLLIEYGFKRLNEEDLYESDTEIYHKGIRFYFLEQKEELNNG